MSNAKAQSAPRKRAREFEVPGRPTDPVLRARWTAIRMAGGPTVVARQLGRNRGEGVRRWYVDLNPTPAEARLLVQWCSGAVTLAEILPDAYKGLTKADLGYAPK